MGGCTSVVVFIKNNIIYCANAGDSRSVLNRNGISIPLSYDHKPDHELERERIYNAGGTVEDGRVNGNLNLSRSLGDIEYKLNKELSVDKQVITAFPDIIEEKLFDKDIIILACDGVWDCMTSQEVCDFINNKLNTEDNTSSIIEDIFTKCIASDVANSSGIGADNMTCIIVRYK